MTPDLDIYRAAAILVKRYGGDAPVTAAMRADAMLEKGDLDGAVSSRASFAAIGSDCSAPSPAGRTARTNSARMKPRCSKRRSASLT